MRTDAATAAATQSLLFQMSVLSGESESTQAVACQIAPIIQNQAIARVDHATYQWVNEGSIGRNRMNCTDASSGELTVSNTCGRCQRSKQKRREDQNKLHGVNEDSTPKSYENYKSFREARREPGTYGSTSSA